ncbi:MAG: redox-regulated ATPase YchF [Rickettsiales bacterium]|nr:redox-regulated ATPase YchF [Pseudomonadota bacterium]MDA0966444.1 redox-regulated ATPase YchF [Pseudomonadota bacterium]MDG4543306.1 redox-regulated ATPase YchF [Rickettsiales bacterium]MDG4545572.1 redox-regulated ATPase YchF [Rickettsiales bacterium]MDG4548021.1 redox-regulated ATPase YchF [Rickettsiales bacterium]
MGFNCGIVGLPNVGKSTLFNALTQTAAAEAANYPFCTIEPNVGRVGVPDHRLSELAKIAASKEIIPTQLEFVDIAGLVKGASKGEGLGNKFLSHIREVDAIVHVLRCFEDGDITHVEGSVDPLRDAEIIETELVLSDLESVEKRIPALEKKLRSQDKEAKIQMELLQRVLKLLEEGKPARKLEVSADEEKAFRTLQLITSKPIMYVCNVAEEDAKEGNEYSAQVAQKANEEGAACVVVSARIEEEIASLENDEEKKEFLETIGLEEAGLNRVIRTGYELLNLITFFTIGPKEARAWTVKKGSLAPKAAGVIHTDFEKGFIRSETISYNDYIANKGEQGCKEAGKMRLEGKEYVTQDGDIMHFRFNV